MAYNDLIYNYTMLGGKIQSSDFSSSDSTVYIKFFDLADPDEDAVDPTASSLNMITLNKSNSRYEIVKINNSTWSYDSDTGITTCPIATNGRDLPNYGAAAGGSTGNSHYVGDEVGCVWNHWPTEILNRKIAGTEATGTNLFKVGDETDSDIYYYAKNADANAPFLMYDASENKWMFSNDGSATAAIGGSTASYTFGDGLTLTAGDVDIDTSDSTIFVKTSLGAADEDLVPILDAAGQLAVGFIDNGDVLAAITSTAAELNKLDGASANVTAANLNTLTAGSSSNADTLHSHQTPTKSFVAGETITTDNAVALIPYAYEKFTQTSEADITLGDANATRKISTEITPAKDISNLTTLYIRGNEAAASTMTLTVTIETDNGGEPSGTPVTNGTANTIDTSTWGASYANRTVTFGSAVSLDAGTKYHIVLSVDKTDAANYLNISYCDARDPGYPSFTGDVYDLDAGTWSAGTAFYWWTASGQDLGCKLYKTDANIPWKTYKFCGFAKAGGAAEADIDVYYDIVPDLSSLLPTENYYLSETAGAITHSPPGTINESQIAAENAYRIGYALDDGTTLRIQPGEKRAVFYEQGLASETIEMVCGFRPAFIRTIGSGSGPGGGVNGFTTAVTYGDAQDENAIGLAAGSAAYYWHDNFIASFNDGGGNTMTVTSGGDTSVGFTLTCTEGGNAGFYLIMEVIG